MIVAQRLAFATAIMTVLLIGVGVLVRATGSGLGCPDWPTCHGGLVPPGHQTALIEFSHRFTASIVGFMVIGVAILAYRHFRQVKPILWVAIATVPLVGFQGILGAITVWHELPAAVVATHLLTAMIVLGCELFVAWAMFRENQSTRGERAGPEPGSAAIGKLALGAIAWLAVVMWVGGYMSESGASTACEGWPACNGGIFPGSDDQEITHMVHRYIAGAFVFLVAPFVVAAWKRRRSIAWAGPVAVAVAVLYAAQVTVGAFNVWFTFPDALTISHTVIAALIWFTLATAAILAYYVPVSVPGTARERLTGREAPA